MLDQENLHIVQARESSCFISFITLRIYFRKKGFYDEHPIPLHVSNNSKQSYRKFVSKVIQLVHNENEHGLYGIAAPIRSYTGRTIAALNIVGPISYMQGSNREIIIQSVMNTANLISKNLVFGNLILEEKR